MEKYVKIKGVVALVDVINVRLGLGNFIYSIIQTFGVSLTLVLICQRQSQSMKTKAQY